MFFSSHHFLSVQLSKRLNRRWVDLRFAGLFILLRGLACWTSKAFSDHIFGDVFYIHTGALQIEQSEESDQGKYECVATNSAGTRYSAPANLYVRGRKVITLAWLLHSGSGGVEMPTGSVWLWKCLTRGFGNDYRWWSSLLSRKLKIEICCFSIYTRLEVCRYLFALQLLILFWLYWLTVLGIRLKFSSFLSLFLLFLICFLTNLEISAWWTTNQL